MAGQQEVKYEQLSAGHTLAHSEDATQSPYSTQSIHHEEEHDHHHKKSMLTKVKERAKKWKHTLAKKTHMDSYSHHSHSHSRTHSHSDSHTDSHPQSDSYPHSKEVDRAIGDMSLKEDDVEVEQEPESHGAPMYDSSVGVVSNKETLPVSFQAASPNVQEPTSAIHFTRDEPSSLKPEVDPEYHGAPMYESESAPIVYKEPAPPSLMATDFSAPANTGHELGVPTLSTNSPLNQSGPTNSPLNQSGPTNSLLNQSGQANSPLNQSNSPRNSSGYANSPRNQSGYTNSPLNQSNQFGHYGNAPELGVGAPTSDKDTSPRQPDSPIEPELNRTGSFKESSSHNPPALVAAKKVADNLPLYEVDERDIPYESNTSAPQTGTYGAGAATGVTHDNITVKTEYGANPTPIYGAGAASGVTDDNITSKNEYGLNHTPGAGSGSASGVTYDNIISQSNGYGVNQTPAYGASAGAASGVTHDNITSQNESGVNQTPAYGASAGAGSGVTHDNISKNEYVANQEYDKGISAKEYVIHKLEPGAEDRALSHMITDAVSPTNAGKTEEPGVVDMVKGAISSLVGNEHNDVKDSSQVSHVSPYTNKSNTYSGEIEQVEERRLQTN